jgi:hypothetical protein
MDELAIKNAAPKTAELFLKKLNLFCFFVTIFCTAIKLHWRRTLLQYNFTELAYILAEYKAALGNNRLYIYEKDF